MKILNRYVLNEMIGPTALGLGFYTFILMMKSLVDLAEMIIKRSLPFSTVMKLLGWSLPHIMVLTIPMALLFGILIAIGRLSSDSEIIAMRALGISTTTIYRPVLYFSLFIFLINLVMMNIVLPYGNRSLVDLRTAIFTSTVTKEIKPRVFYDEYENRVIYINDMDASQNLWKGVFISDTTDSQRQQIIVAQTGKLLLVKETNQLWLDLRNTQTHVFNTRKPDRYDLNSNASQRVLMPDKFGQGSATTRNSLSIREMNLFELLDEFDRAASRDPAERRLVLVEIHKKFSIPFACLAFGIVGLPLGITNRRGGKSSGFSLSIAIILVYYLLISNGEDLARSGRLPAWLAMWMGNIVLVGLGIFLIRRANADRGSSWRGTGFFRRHFDRVVAWFSSRKAAGGQPVETSSLLSRLDVPFPNTLDRYVLREFIKVIGLVLMSSSALFLIVDYSAISSDIIDNHIAAATVVAYYRFFFIHVLDQVMPISILLGTLITFGMFSKNNEITAMKGHGISLYRVTLPVMVVAAIVSVLSFFMLDFVLPYSNEQANKLKNQIQGKETRRTFNPQQKQWIFGKGKYLFNFLSYDKEAKSLSQVQVFEFDPVTFRLTRRVWAEEARFDGTGWVFVNGWIRSFSDDGTSSYSPIYTPLRLQYPERPEYFAMESKPPEQMTFAQLRRYIQDLRRSGYPSDELMVKLYQKTSWPFISLIMAAIALPFSFRMGKRGALYGVGLAMFLGFIYLILFGIFTKFGEVGNLPSLLSAWSANILFGLAAVYMFLRVET